MNKERVNELLATMKSFEKEKYCKSEILDEMLALQQEIVNITFGQERAELENLQIMDVVRHFEQLNEELGNAVDEELKVFVKESLKFCNMIRKEIYGRKGEYKAFRALERIRTQNYVLKNVEFSDGERKSELDAVVITPFAISIVEVKNTTKDIYIDEGGNYLKTGEFLVCDGNLGTKMRYREELLRNALSTAGYGDVEINKIVVFSNNRIEVHNRCKELKTCFLSQLPYLVEGNSYRFTFSEEDMAIIKTCIEDSEKKEAYAFGFDVEKYKRDFAILMAKFEDVSMQARAEEDTDVGPVMVASVKKKSFGEKIKGIFTSKFAGYVGGAATAVTGIVVAKIILNIIRK